MPFRSLAGNEPVKNLLKRSVRENRIAQGLLFAGPRGVGKYRFALSLAQALNCERPGDGDSCGECIQCRKIAAGEHLDVMTVSRDGQFIKIEQMRGMSRESMYRPFEGRRRVLIVDEAERLNEKAASSILKTIEEPPETSLIILVTSKPYLLLETIRSRCQMINFGPVSREQIEEHIHATAARPREEIQLLSRLARGSVGRTLEIDLGEYREKRKVILTLMGSLLLRTDASQMMESAEYFGRKLERDGFVEHLEILLTLLEDAMFLKHNMPEMMTNIDILAEIQALTNSIPMEKIFERAEQVEQILRALTRNINRYLAMEAMLVT